MLMDDTLPKAPDDFYVPEESSASNSGESIASAIEPVRWSASEFLHHQKNLAWYLYAVIALLAAAALLYVFSRDIIGPAAIVILGGLLLVGAARKPRVVEYIVDNDGIVVGSRQYSYNDFQSFSIVHEDQIESITLLPSKRFSPVVSIYFSPEDGQKIFDILGTFLPFEQREKDQIDKFLHKIKF
jgi:hypothetical protein